jgi:hypothetical protein
MVPRPEKRPKEPIVSVEGNVRYAGKEVNSTEVYHFEMHVMNVRLLSD